MENGNIVRGLGGVPSEGPVVLVGSHMLLGSEISSLVQEFLIEKNIMVHGMAYREIFSPRFEDSSKLFTLLDILKVFGAFPVSARNICKVLSNKSHVLLYPGGIREALHRKVFSCFSSLIYLLSTFSCFSSPIYFYFYDPLIICPFI